MERIKLETPYELGGAKQFCRTVHVYYLDDGELGGRGYIIDFDEHTIKILNQAVGILGFFRDQVEIYLETKVDNS